MNFGFNVFLGKYSPPVSGWSFFLVGGVSKHVINSMAEGEIFVWFASFNLLPTVGGRIIGPFKFELRAHFEFLSF